MDSKQGFQGAANAEYPPIKPPLHPGEGWGEGIGFTQRLSNPRTLTHTGIPNPIQLNMSQAPSPNSALNKPVTLTSPIARGMANTFQKFD